MKFFSSFLVFATMIAVTGCAHARQPNCSDPVTARAEIDRTIHDLFDALREDDEASFKRLTTESFYAFDVGKRFDGTELLDAIRSAHAEGVQINWSIGPIDTKLSCDVAWSAWENIGSAGIPPDLQPVRWLESAVIVRENERWKIDFFHSQRAAKP
ncbi:nuclear transport factor 2 family protein [Pacificimonas sp. WHA3]|uniref:Nuclear transport factor 2 family protein n=1 Tax=Pacificimonas pallii TaxID=2827236 RepID=A0ABS6SHQ8_9SPHN|nr:nuclear transport factor 2 family protein [Pacificimonas pallii]MBV7257871.1 nuclear transport factor 2 family protein [Pacificimonas pallii]